MLLATQFSIQIYYLGAGCTNISINKPPARRGSSSPPPSSLLPLLWCCCLLCYLRTRSTLPQSEQWASIITLFAPLGIASDRRRRMSGVPSTTSSRSCKGEWGEVEGRLVWQDTTACSVWQHLQFAAADNAQCIYENELLLLLLPLLLRLRCAIC